MTNYREFFLLLGGSANFSKGKWQAAAAGGLPPGGNRERGLPLDKLPTLPPLLQLFLQEPTTVFGNVTAGKDIRDGYTQ